MELIGQKIVLEREIISHIQIYLMNLLNTQDVVYNVDGEVVSEVNASPYCKTLRFVSERRDLCQFCSRELSKSAIHYKKQFEDVCPSGLTILSVPISLDEHTVVGAHSVVISNTPRSKFSVYDIASQFNIDVHILWDAVKKTPLVPKPILKIAREQAISATELMSRVLTRIYTLKQSEASMAEKYHSIEEIFKSHNISK
ncbi:MAG: PocR ligand-binding domain-containing protein [Planctomycetes bacterium]|uniref:PocR ligand-binding domain-containing protein n=1 Tax=Candidatus Wunengus californicus TaxID=3367619 RepID=UPI0040283254|nr:PocR ligand-binding domain-containing protein [Planctomycetota bacterium]MBI4221548.1 PocR ligand-binding domain-containing protein [Planctomycetota bacterium]